MAPAPDRGTALDEGFVDVLASGVHDTKNTLFDALGRIAAVKRTLAAGPAPDPEITAALIEAGGAIERSADRLARLLSAYRLIRQENPVVLLPAPLQDFADYLRLRAGEAWQGAAKLTVNPAPNEVWFLDRELIADCLINALTNASRHARETVVLDLRIEADWLSLTVTDDGAGYADNILRGEIPTASVGLFIADKLAGLHERNGRRGRLTLANRQDGAGGAVFTLTLP